MRAISKKKKKKKKFSNTKSAQGLEGHPGAAPVTPYLIQIASEIDHLLCNVC